MQTRRRDIYSAVHSNPVPNDRANAGVTAVALEQRRRVRDQTCRSQRILEPVVAVMKPRFTATSALAEYV
jgi:hypothetical protein